MAREGPESNLYGIFTRRLRYSSSMNFRQQHRDFMGYASAVLAVVACTLAGFAMRPRFDIVNVAMVYLLAVVIVSMRTSRGPAILCAAASVAVFDFLFVPPEGTLTIQDAQYLLTFVIMVGVTVVISGLMAKSERENAERTALAVEAETERIRSTLLASISHDLRTPLSVIAGAASSLAERGEQIASAEREALARSLYGQARDMSEQVDKVLQMTRLEMGTIALKRDWASLPEIVGSVLSRLAERLARHTVVLDLPPDLPLMRVDAPLIEQVLVNLLENAARHTPTNTLVHIRALLATVKPSAASNRSAASAPSTQELVVSVEDFGPGLEDRDVERIFDKFYRREAEGPVAGVGLGLAICRAIVMLHGGRIWAEQIPGGGTAFRFALPVEPAPQAPAEGPES